MKRSIGRYGGLVALLAGMLCVSAGAKTTGDFEYDIEEDEVTITEYVGEGGEVTIPSTIQGYPVTTIGRRSFDSTVHDKKVTKVTIPFGVTAIEASAFNGTATLTEVVLPESLETIGDRAFRKTLLEQITIPDRVTKIGKNAFNKCVCLSTVKLPAGLDRLEDYVFCECAALERITLPDSLEYIQYFAFARSGLRAITLPASVKKLDTKAFKECENLQEVTFGYGLKSIGRSCFLNCTALQRVELPTSLRHVESGAFDGTGLETLIFPYGVKTIGAMSSMNALRTLCVPSTAELDSIAACPNSTVYCVAGSDAEVTCKKLPAVPTQSDDSVDSPIHVLCNGNRISFGAAGQKPWMESGCTLVPLRALLEAMGATVHWNSATATVTATYRNDTLTLAVGDTVLYKNRTVAASLPVPAQMRNNRLVVPIRAVVEAVGGQVTWNPAAGIVRVTTEQNNIV